MSKLSAPVGDTLEELIGQFLQTVPETWTEYDWAALSESRERALYELTAAGMIERRLTIRLVASGHPLVVEATITCTGQGGLSQALEYVLADTWNDWRDTFGERRSGDLKDAPMFHCQRIGKEQWRLTADGVQARRNLDAGQSSRVFDFVLQRGFFDGQPRLLPDGRISQPLPVGGKGNLERMQRVSPDTCPSGVNIINWHEGAQALGVAFTELLKTRETQAAAPAEPAAPRPEGGSKPSEAPAELPDLVTLDPAAVAAKAKGRIKPASKREVPRGKLDEHASIELTKNPSLTYEQLATMLGCKPGTLRDKRKCPLLAAAKTRNKATKQEFYGKDKWTDRRPDD